MNALELRNENKKKNKQTFKVRTHAVIIWKTLVQFRQVILFMSESSRKLK